MIPDRVFLHLAAVQSIGFIARGIWLPSMFLGRVANKATAVPPVASKLEARATLAVEDDSLLAAQRDRLRVLRLRRTTGF